MSSGHTTPRFIFKIKADRLKRSKWNLKLSVEQARKNEELIALNNSQILRWLDELNGINTSEEYISSLRKKVNKLKKDPDIKKTKDEIKKLLDELDRLLFKKDYICIVMDKRKLGEYEYLKNNGVTINGIKYRRLLGTTGGVKNAIIVFINEEYIGKIRERIDNGRDKNVAFTPAKLEAYKALVCSASTPLSMPKGICVVHDCITHFKDDVIMLDDTGVDEPKMEYKKNEDIELIDSDGYGLGSPELMKRWGEELGLDYIIPGCVIRQSFCKGAIFCVDFRKFAKDNNIKYITDVWGTIHSIKNIELILTESMLKLWDSYHSIYMYLYNCNKNKYTFATTKVSEPELENERNTNYQFIQPYTNFTEEDIDELLAPTINEIKDITSGDYRKMILYTKGMGLNEDNVKHLDNNPMTALMIDERMQYDPFIRKMIRDMISKRIDEAKVGTLKFPANYSLVSGDPYSLCQSMFGMKVTGLLKAGEVYSQYWAKKGVNKISCFRAPMTSHNNIRLMNVVHNNEMDEFYKYLTTPTVFNSWDTCDKALNGMDKDGDCVINTSMDVIVRNTKQLPAIMCVQRKAAKCIPEEDDFFISNINSFGNEVGSTTNKITSMFDVQAGYKEGSREFNILQYRILCGQLYQQNAIDKTKGIDAKPMPIEWSSWKANKITTKNKDGDIYELQVSNKRKKNMVLNRNIIAEHKPYFMRYIYPTCNTEYVKYINSNSDKCKMNFNMTLQELENKENKNEKEENFLKYYKRDMPLGMNDCVINKICWKVEKEFDEKINDKAKIEFDYTILKDNDFEYTKSLYKKIEKLYKEYIRDISDYNQTAKKNRTKSSEKRIARYVLKSEFQTKCYEQCPNEKILANILIDMCYNNNSSKQFVWDMCGNVLLDNLLKINNYNVTFPTKDNDGDIVFNGERFKMVTCCIKDEVDVVINEEEIDEFID